MSGRQRLVRTQWKPGKMPPSPTFHFPDDQEEYERHVMNSIEHYPEVVSMDLEGVTFTEVMEWFQGEDAGRLLDAQGHGGTDRVAALSLIRHLLRRDES